MKRDWKTIKRVLEDVERDVLEERLTSVEGEDEAEYYGHLWLCIDAGLVVGVEVNTAPNGDWRYSSDVPRLTMSGHDMLGAIRSKTVWTAVKEKAEQAMIPISVDLIKAVLLAISR